MQHLIERGATVLVIEHDLDLIRCADWVIYMGPGGGMEGGRIIEQDSPAVLLAPGARTRTGDFCGKLANLRPADAEGEMDGVAPDRGVGG